MSVEVFENDVTTALYSGIDDITTTIDVVPGTGDLFPVLVDGDFFRAVITSSVTPGEDYEYIIVTAVTGDTLTVVRGQEGAPARAWDAGSILYMTATAASMTSFAQAVGDWAPINSPHFTGIPTAPTPPDGTDDTQLATTEFVMNAIQAIASGNLPSGSVIFVARDTAPSGYLAADGSAVSRDTYSALFTAIGTVFGEGDGSTTFNLPDLRGQFIRGWSDDGSIDPARVFGSSQAGAFESHTHTATGVFSGTKGTTTSNGAHSHTVNMHIGANPAGGSGGIVNGNTLPTSTAGAHTHSFTPAGSVSVVNTNTGGTETRPTNVALLACIKT